MMQCCAIRMSTLQRLVRLYRGPQRLSAVMRAALLHDAAAPVLLQPHLDALDRRVAKVLRVIADCASSKPIHEVVVDDGVYWPKPWLSGGEEEVEEEEEEEEKKKRNYFCQWLRILSRCFMLQDIGLKNCLGTNKQANKELNALNAQLLIWKYDEILFWECSEHPSVSCSDSCYVSLWRDENLRDCCVHAWLSLGDQDSCSQTILCFGLLISEAQFLSTSNPVCATDFSNFLTSLLQKISDFTNSLYFLDI